MKTASVRDLRNHFAKVSRWLEAGEKIKITKRGTPVGMFTPIARTKARKQKRKRFNLEEHRKWMKETYGDKVLPGNGVLLMREGSKW